MSKRLRDSAERHIQKTISLMQESKNKEALKELEKAEEASLKAKAYDFSLSIQTIKGHLMQISGAYEEALKIHTHFLKSY